MNRLDKKIKKMAKQTECPVSKGYEERVEYLLENLNGENVKLKKNNRFSMSKAGFAACALCAAVLIAVPVTAKVSSAVTERMERMSKKEQKAYEEMNDPKKLTKEHEVEGIRYSRELSEDEDKRERELFKKYEEEALFPKGKLQVVDKLEEDMEIVSPFYEVWNREFFLPERELTDEELLQMIDLMYKQSYAVENSADTKKATDAQKEFMENPYPGENDMSKEEAIAKTSVYLESMYDIDASAMEKTAEFVMGDESEDGGYGEYAVTFKGKDGWSYKVNLNGESGVLTGIWSTRGEQTYCIGYGQPVAVDEKLRNVAYEKAKEKLIAMLGTDTQIVNSTCEFFVDKENKVKDGAIYIPFELDNGYVYQFVYIVDEDILGAVYRYGTKGYSGLSTHVSREGFVVIPME